ncbi:hypothetical protein RSAG8_09539, partial [Rhizoctonia solani AG-8 WAC10335]
MTLVPGRYFIQGTDDEEQFVGIGPILIYPPPPLPLRYIEGFMKNLFTVNSLEGHVYELKTQDAGVGYHENNNVRLTRWCEKSQPWCVEHGDAQGSYRIRIPNEGRYWTAPEDDDLALIKLESANGRSNQEWKFVKYES